MVRKSKKASFANLTFHRILGGDGEAKLNQTQLINWTAQYCVLYCIFRPALCFDNHIQSIDIWFNSMSGITCRAWPFNKCNCLYQKYPQTTCMYGKVNLPLNESLAQAMHMIQEGGGEGQRVCLVVWWWWGGCNSCLWKPDTTAPREAAMPSIAADFQAPSFFIFSASSFKYLSCWSYKSAWWIDTQYA